MMFLLLEVDEVFVVRLYPLIHLPKIILNSFYCIEKKKKPDNIQLLVLEDFSNDIPSQNQYSYRRERTEKKKNLLWRIKYPKKYTSELGAYISEVNMYCWVANITLIGSSLLKNKKEYQSNRFKEFLTYFLINPRLQRLPHWHNKTLLPILVTNKYRILVSENIHWSIKLISIDINTFLDANVMHGWNRSVVQSDTVQSADDERKTPLAIGLQAIR
jgi:hypothetical protein